MERELETRFATPLLANTVYACLVVYTHTHTQTFSHRLYPDVFQIVCRMLTCMQVSTTRSHMEVSSVGKAGHDSDSPPTYTPERTNEDGVGLLNLNCQIV